MGVETQVGRTRPAPLDADVEDVAGLKAVLEQHGFLGDGARKALGAEIGPAHMRTDLPLYLRRLAAPRPVNTLLKLFSLRQWQTVAEASAAIAPVSLDGLMAAGLLEAGPRGVRALVGLSVHGDLALAHDAPDPERPVMEPDHVLGTNAPAVTLDCLTVRKPSRKTLDLGVGGGVQSLRCAPHSDRVIALDLSPRALAFARFNARLNGVSGVEFREGNLFAPVEGERFDLIVSNPPYVISPESRFVFQDGGRPGDSLSEEVVRRAPDHLEEGGFATILVNWALRDGQPWDEPVRAWVEGNGCDVWLLRGDVQDGLTYAAVWNRGRGPTEYGPALDAWVAYYREAGIDSIGMGAVIMRRRAGGRNWIRADVLPNDPVKPCHEEIVRVFAAQDRLCALTSDALVLAERFRLVEDHLVVQKLRRRGEDYTIEEAEIQLTGGLAFRGVIDPYTLHLLRRCDGTRPIASVVNELVDGAGADRDRMRSVVAEATRRLAGLGFLVPEGAGEGPAPDKGN